MRIPRVRIGAVIAVGVVAVSASLPVAAAPRLAPTGAVPFHDFDRATLRSYIDFRFSSAVPLPLIRTILRIDGFSQRDIDLVDRWSHSDAASPSGYTESGATAGSVRYHGVRQISRSRLPCPESDSNCELDTEVEPDIAVNPVAPGNVVGVFQMDRYSNGGAVNTGWAASFDGGKTWPVRGPAPDLTVAVSGAPTDGPGAPFERASDPVVAFDRKHHVVFLESIGVADAGCAVYCDSAITVNISTDRGHTFGPPVIVHEDVASETSPPVVFNDKEWIVTDNNPTSPYYGRTYVSWDQVRCADPACNSITEQPVEVRYSDDGGQTWSPVQDAVNELPGEFHQSVGVQPVVLPNGHVVIVYADATAGAFTFAGQYKAILSTDGGATWSDPVALTTADPFPEENNHLRAPNIPSVAVSATGIIWVAYQDQRFGPGRNDILLQKSRDEGQTWSDPINITPDESDIDHFTPDIAVQGRVIFLTYRAHDPVNVRASPTVEVVYRKIRAGKTIYGPKKVFRSSDADLAAFTTGGALKFFGDYAGIAVGGRYAHPIWGQAQTFRRQTDNPTGTHERMYSARLT